MEDGPVQNTLMPAWYAQIIVADTVVDPFSLLAQTNARSRRDTFTISRPIRAIRSSSPRVRPARTRRIDDSENRSRCYDRCG